MEKNKNIKFERTLITTGKKSITISSLPPQILGVMGLESGAHVLVWYDPEKNIICIGVKK